MKVESLRDLDKLLVLCRKRGVQSIRVDGIEFHLGELPVTSSIKRHKAVQVENVDINTPDQLTEEQRLFGSSDPSVWLTDEQTIKELERIRLGQNQ